MAQPTPYDRDLLNGETYFTQWTTDHPTVPQQGNKIDQELNAIALTLSETLANLALIQRDDGALANGSVDWDQLTAEVQDSISELVLSSATPAALGGTATAGASTQASRADHVHAIPAPPATDELFLRNGQEYFE